MDEFVRSIRLSIIGNNSFLDGGPNTDFLLILFLLLLILKSMHTVMWDMLQPFVKRLIYKTRACSSKQNSWTIKIAHIKKTQNLSFPERHASVSQLTFTGTYLLSAMILELVILLQLIPLLLTFIFECFFRVIISFFAK